MTAWGTTVRLVAPVLALSLACGQEGQGRTDSSSDRSSEDPSTSGEVLETESDEGPVKATVTLSPAQPRLGDVLELTLRVEHGSDIRAELPPFGEALGRFTVLEFVPRRERGKDGTITQTQIYSLQTPGSGKQRIPALRIEYQTEGDDQIRELLTDELAVDIEPVVPGAEVSRELGPPPDELDASPGWPWWIWPAAGVLSIPLVVLLLVALRKRKLRAIRRQQLGAYDAAMRRLRDLSSRPLPGADEVDDWYVELSSIVRRYLEDRLQIRAPELTTEEFLSSAQGHGQLEREVKTGLSEFLAACDKVKFAAYRPNDDETTSTLALAEELLKGQEQHLRELESRTEEAA